MEIVTPETRAEAKRSDSLMVLSDLYDHLGSDSPETHLGEIKVVIDAALSSGVDGDERGLLMRDVLDAIHRSSEDRSSLQSFVVSAFLQGIADTLNHHSNSGE